MSYRDISAFIQSADHDASVIDLATRVAEQFSDRAQAHLSFVAVHETPSGASVTIEWPTENFWDTLYRRCEEELEETVGALQTRMRASSLPFATERILLARSSLHRAVALRALHSDIAIVSRPQKDQNDACGFPGLLFESGRPVLLAPPDWKAGPVGSSIMICWKASREAARALSAAAPFLEASTGAIIATVDAQPSDGGYGQVPGADVAANVSRHCSKVEVVSIASAGRSEWAALQDLAEDRGADLIVMGGYGRSRISEWAFGGVTREMLKTARIPVLIAH